MDKIDIAKKTVSVIVGSGTGTIVKAFLENNLDLEDANTYTKVTVPVAGIVIGMMAKDATKSYTNAKIDGYAAKWQAFKLKQAQDQKTA